jgi:pimeloyl-ACP methyl ester carboxylesterase
MLEPMSTSSTENTAPMTASVVSPTWVFLRGLTRESRHWGRFVDEFAQALPGSRVMALDLPGNGHLNSFPSPTRVPAMVAHCRRQLALRQVDGPVRLLAMSLGAMVAVAWAQAHPQEVVSQVLINTSLRPFSPFYQRLKPANYGLMLRLVLSRASDEAWESAVLRLTSNHWANQPEAVLPQWLALRAANPVSRANALRQLLAAAGYRAPAQPPAVPTLLLASENDQLVSPDCSTTLARAWRTPLRLHPSAGHDLPLDDGPWVAAQVRDWLASTLPTPASAP